MHTNASSGRGSYHALGALSKNEGFKFTILVLFPIKKYPLTKMTTAAPKSPRESTIELNTLMMPEHANLFGNVHGGIVMKLADEAAAITAMRHAQKPAVTVAVDSMTFQRPVHIGEIVRCRALISYTHKSSMEIEVIVTAEEPISGKTTLTNQAHFVFVALNDDGTPDEVPGILIETKRDQELFDAAQRRQRRRLEERSRQSSAAAKS